MIQRHFRVPIPGTGVPFHLYPWVGNRWQNQALAAWTEFQNCHGMASAGMVRPHQSPTAGPMATFTRLPSGRHRAQIKLRGARDSRSFRTRTEAVRWAAEREAEIERELSASPAARYTLADLLRRYRDEVTPLHRGARPERTRIDAILRHYPALVSIKLSELTPERLGEWRDERLLEVKKATVTRYMTVFTSALEHGRREWRWLSVNPMRDVKRPSATKHRERTLHWREIRAMLRTAGVTRGRCQTVTEAAARAMLFGLRCGMRAGEICALRWEDVHADFARVQQQKGKIEHEGRDVPLSRGARRVLEGMRGWDRERVFGMTAQTLDAMYRKLRRRAKVGGFTFHDTRHTAATIISRKVDVLTLCKIFGWKDLKRALTYYNPTASEIAKRLK